MENVPEAPVPTVDGYLTDIVIVNNRWVAGDDGVQGAEQNRLRRFTFGTRDGRKLQIDYAALEAPYRFVPGGDGHEAVREPNTVLSSLDRVPVKIGGSGKVKASVISGNGFGSGSNYYKRVGAGTVTGSDGGHSNHPRAIKQTRYTLANACALQGFPEDFFEDTPFTADGKAKMVANAVPRYLAVAVAKAVKRAMED